jgi:cytosine/adenosine deaminase-related metal-dependent hydrolase
LKPGTLRAFIPDGILLNAFAFHQHHALVVDKIGRITDVCDVDDLDPAIEQTRCPGQLLTAAPILAHAHLESFDAPSKGFSHASFAQWAQSLIEWRDSPSRLSAEESASASREQLAQNGCGLVATHVAEPGAEGDISPDLPEVFAFTELFIPSGDMPELPDYPYRGVALHAPYSVCDKVARQVFAQCTADNVVSIHLGEHAEERQFLEDGSGELADLFRERQLPLKDNFYSSPVDWLEEVGGLSKNTIAVHCTNLSADELLRLEDAEVAVVFCPGTHKYFERPKPAFAEVASLIPALGCDSLASNQCLDPLYELRCAKEIVPEISSQMWWQALTMRGAEVLRRPDLGSLAQGKWARVLSFPSKQFESCSNAEQVCELLCSAENLPRELISLHSFAE